MGNVEGRSPHIFRERIGGLDRGEVCQPDAQRDWNQVLENTSRHLELHSVHRSVRAPRAQPCSEDRCTSRVIRDRILQSDQRVRQDRSKEASWSRWRTSTKISCRIILFPGADRMLHPEEQSTIFRWNIWAYRKRTAVNTGDSIINLHQRPWRCHCETCKASDTGFGCTPQRCRHQNRQQRTKLGDKWVWPSSEILWRHNHPRQKCVKRRELIVATQIYARGLQDRRKETWNNLQ